MDFTVRRATAGDAARLSDFAARAFHDTFSAQNRPEDMEAYLAQTFSPALQAGEIARDDVLLVESGGEIAGYAELGQGPAPFAAHAPIELKRFYVDRAWHGRGVARRLFDAVLEQARVRGADTLWLGVWERNERAKAFYAKLGFTRIGEQVFMLGSDPQTDWVMARPVRLG